MDTERRMTTQEMLTQHKKLMDEAQRLEPSVMVTERNWNAMLKMQHDLFQQQMQLDADLKTLLTREDAQTALNEMQESTEKFEKQAGSLNERYSSSCKTLTESTKLTLTETLNDTKKQLSDTVQEAQTTLDKMQKSAEKFERQVGNLNETYSSGCKALTESTKNALATILDDTRKQLSDTVQEARKEIRLCVWISITAVICCAALCALVVLWSR